jgi:hypothetical protein
MPTKKKEVSTQVLNPELVAVKKKAEKLLKTWEKPIVKTAEQFESAGAAVKDFASVRKELQSICNPEIKAAKEVYDAKRDAFKAVDAIIASGETAIRDALVSYTEAHRKAQEIKVERAIASGNDTKAAAIAAKPYIPDVSGVSFVERWHGEITDLKAFLKAILDGKIPSEAIEPNLVWLNTQARAAKAEDIGVPGAKGVKETSSSVRA